MGELKGKINGDLVREIRQKKGLSAEEMAVALGIKSHYLYMIERNERIPSLSLLFRISELLQIPPSILLTSKDFQITAKLLVGELEFDVPADLVGVIIKLTSAYNSHN